MSKKIDDFLKLTNAEDFFEFFDLPYDRQIFNVNRLHILKLFSEYIAEIDSQYALATEEEKFEKYRDALQRSYERFLTETAQQTKLFKVFNEKPQNVVLLSEINAG
jgi:nitrogenase-stabilizing/protective protein